VRTLSYGAHFAAGPLHSLLTSCRAAKRADLMREQEMLAGLPFELREQIELEVKVSVLKTAPLLVTAGKPLPRAGPPQPSPPRLTAPLWAAKMSEDPDRFYTQLAAGLTAKIFQPDECIATEVESGESSLFIISKGELRYPRPPEGCSWIDIHRTETGKVRLEKADIFVANLEEGRYAWHTTHSVARGLIDTAPSGSHFGAHEFLHGGSKALFGRCDGPASHAVLLL
jgi:hypothetical protein